MPGMDLTAEDVGRTVLLEKDWYNFLVKEVAYVPSKSNSENMNYRIDWIGLDEKNKDVPLTRFFPDTEKARFFIIPFLKAAGFKIGKTGATGVDPMKTKGVKMQVYVKQKEYEGRLQNEAADFREIPRG